MPIPFIAGAIIAGTALHGIAKTIEATDAMNDAKQIDRSAKQYAKEAEDFIAMAQDKTREAIENFGQKKIRVLSQSVQDFVTTFEKIKHVDFSSSAGIDELRNFNPSSEDFKLLKKASFEASQVAINGIAAIGSGALIAYGTYSTVMGGLGGLLVTATGGTALSALSGAAATNATLAWLGGGALSAGGFGIAGGTAVLGGLVFGPALAIGGSVFASQAQTKLNNAHSNLDQAKAFRAQAKNIGVALKGICTRAEQLTAVLSQLDEYFVQAVSRMKKTVLSSGTDYRYYSKNEKRYIYECVQLVQTIKIILDASLLKEDGTLNEATAKTLSDGRKYLQALN